MIGPPNNRRRRSIATKNLRKNLPGTKDHHDKPSYRAACHDRSDGDAVRDLRIACANRSARRGAGQRRNRPGRKTQGAAEGRATACGSTQATGSPAGGCAAAANTATPAASGRSPAATSGTATAAPCCGPAATPGPAASTACCGSAAASDTAAPATCCGSAAAADTAVATSCCCATATSRAGTACGCSATCAADRNTARTHAITDTSGGDDRARCAGVANRADASSGRAPKRHPAGRRGAPARLTRGDTRSNSGSRAHGRAASRRGNASDASRNRRARAYRAAFGRSSSGRSPGGARSRAGRAERCAASRPDTKCAADGGPRLPSCT